MSTSDAGTALPKGFEDLVSLLRVDPFRAESLLADMSLGEQAEIVLAARPEDRAQLMYLVQDTEGIVRSLPEIEFHRTVQAVGKWELQELVEVATEDQLNFMLDHDCWGAERLDSRRFCDWLRLFLACDDDDQTLRLFTAISADTLAFALKKHVRFDRDIMIDDVYYCDPEWVTATNAPVREFLERLYALDPNLWIRLMGWIRTHSKPTIEADAIEAHESRMRGKGFPTPTLAITIYYPVDFDVQSLIADWRRTYCAQYIDTQRPRLPALHQRDELFVQIVFQRVGREADSSATPHVARLEASLVEMANKVMIADQVDIGDRKREREALDKVKRWTNIGLELASSRDTELAVRLIKERGIEYFFRISAMLFDALGTAVVELTKAERRSGGRLAFSPMASSYYPLLEPEPHIPSAAGGASGQVIASAAGCRYAWNLVWSFEAMLATRFSAADIPLAQTGE